MANAVIYPEEHSNARHKAAPCTVFLAFISPVYFSDTQLASLHLSVFVLPAYGDCYRTNICNIKRVVQTVGRNVPTIGHVVPIVGCAVPTIGRVVPFIKRIVPNIGRVATAVGRVVPITGRITPIAGRVVPNVGRVVPEQKKQVRTVCSGEINQKLSEINQRSNINN